MISEDRFDDIERELRSLRREVSGLVEDIAELFEQHSRLSHRFETLSAGTTMQPGGADRNPSA